MINCQDKEQTSQKAADFKSAILILHGWGSSSKNWGRVKEILESRGYKVFIPDLPGFGEAPRPQQPWAIDDYVEWLGKFSEKENISRFFLLGHSFGGAVAVKFSLKYPQKIEKLFLVASSGIRQKTLKKRLLKTAAALFKKLSLGPFYSLARRAFYKFIVRSDYPYAQGVMKETFLKVISEDISSYFNRISIPTIIIWGEKDNVVPISNGYFMNREIKNSKLVIIPGADHDLERDVPEILSQKISESL